MDVPLNLILNDMNTHVDKTNLFENYFENEITTHNFVLTLIFIFYF